MLEETDFDLNVSRKPYALSTFRRAVFNGFV